METIKKTFSEKEKTDYIIKSFPKAKIKNVRCFKQCNVIAIKEEEDDNIVFFLDMDTCKKEKLEMKLRNRLCYLKVENEEYIKKISLSMIFF